MGDHELLRAYCERASNEAFAALVQRHLGLVYSAARRQVQSQHLAEEVAQSVFIDLARSAGKLRPGQPLAAWLFIVTRRTAIDVLRREARRRAREQAAAEIGTMKNMPSIWTQIEPWLDDALASLSEGNRAAVLLRFFENQPLRDVGVALGISEDAAQKRMDRALEHLRGYFSKRGVVIGAAGLAADLSAHALEGVPATLGSTISVAASTVAATPLSHLFIMTSLQKLGFSAALILSLGVGLYEATELSRARNNNAALTRRVDELSAENRTLRAEQSDAARQLADTRARLSSLQAAAVGGDPLVESALEAWLGRVRALSAWVEKMPDRRIPEMKLLTQDDWLEAAKNAKVDTELGAREALANLRRLALQRFSKTMDGVIRKYQAGHPHQLPDNPSDLAAYLDPSIDPAILLDYEKKLLAGAKVVDKGGGTPTTVLASKIVDDMFDYTYGYTPGGAAVIQYVRLSRDAVLVAAKQYSAANLGQTPTTAAQLSSYLKRPVDPTYVEQVLREVH